MLGPLNDDMRRAVGKWVRGTLSGPQCRVCLDFLGWPQPFGVLLISINRHFFVVLFRTASLSRKITKFRVWNAQTPSCFAHFTLPDESSQGVERMRNIDMFVEYYD